MKFGYRALLALALVAGVLAGVAFGGGVLYGRNSAPKAVSASTTSAAPRSTAPAAAVQAVSAVASATPSARGGGAGRGAGGQGGGGGAGGGNPLAGTVDGAIESVSGSTLTIRTAAGIEQQVMVGPDTRVQELQPGSATDLQPGAVILVQGTPGAGGALTAGSITITTLPPSAGARSGGPLIAATPAP